MGTSASDGKDQGILIFDKSSLDHGDLGGWSARCVSEGIRLGPRPSDTRSLNADDPFETFGCSAYGQSIDRGPFGLMVITRGAFAKDAIATGQSPIFDLSELVTGQGLRSVSADQGPSFVSDAKRDTTNVYSIQATAITILLRAGITVPHFVGLPSTQRGLTTLFYCFF
jgi:hypothetical protein